MEAALTLQRTADSAVTDYYNNSLGNPDVKMNTKIEQMQRIAGLKQEESKAWHHLSVSATDSEVKNMAQNMAEASIVYAKGWQKYIDDSNRAMTGGKSKRRKSRRRRKSNKRIKSNKRR